MWPEAVPLHTSTLLPACLHPFGFTLSPRDHMFQDFQPVLKLVNGGIADTSCFKTSELSAMLGLTSLHNSLRIWSLEP